MVAGTVLPSAIGRTLTAIQRTQTVVDRLSNVMATGKKVATVLDNPQNYFAARALDHRASDLGRVLDGIERSISTVQMAINGVEALTHLLNQADTIVGESQQMLFAGEVDPDLFEFEVDNTPPSLSSQILADNPVGYWRLNETAGGTALNLGSGGGINGTYQNGVTQGNAGLYENAAGTSAGFDGVNDRVTIPNSALINTANHALRTIELVFNANTTAGRQVLYEEGGNTNSINIYIDNGLIYFNSRDAGNYGPFNINAPIVAGQTYHAAIVLDTNANYFRGYLDGEIVGQGVANNPLASHTDGIAIGALNGSSYMHDGASPANTYRFNGFISDVALYNRALDPDELASHAQAMNNDVLIEMRQRQYEDVLAQIDQLIEDTSYRGQSILAGDDITTYFNERRTSSLVIEGEVLTSGGLNLLRNDFDNEDDLTAIRDNLRTALERVRNFGSGLVNDLTILEGRREMNYGMRVTLIEGSDKLTMADTNQAGAALLATQMRLTLGMTALNLANVSNRSILSLFA
ncbi:MAG: hypothetical protein KKA05_00615 [Alphaproteobacteria bacterium]|nr:hypothetical protein [Alphaproteobacteria bacterium]